MPEACNEDSDLEDVCGDKEVESDRGPAVCLEEDHEEAEANEDHDMHVLEDGVISLHLVGSIETSCACGEGTGMHTICILGEEQIQDDDYNLAKQEDCLKGSVWIFHLKNDRSGFKTQFKFVNKT